MDVFGAINSASRFKGQSAGHPNYSVGLCGVEFGNGTVFVDGLKIKS